METRREDRIPVDRPITVTVLGDPEILLTASAKNASPRGLGVMTTQSVKSGAAVKIEIGDSIFLGEAQYCHATEGGYYVSIELTEVLSGLAALAKMAQIFQEQLQLLSR